MTIDAWLKNLENPETRRIDGHALMRRTIGQRMAIGIGQLLLVIFTAILFLLPALGAYFIFFVVWSISGEGTAVIVIMALFYVGVGGVFVVGFIQSISRSAVVYNDSTKAVEEYVNQKGLRDMLPSELDIIAPHVGEISKHGGGHLKTPQLWLVSEQRAKPVEAIGEALVFDSFALDHEFVGAVVAYGIARLNNDDGVFKIALWQYGQKQSELPNKKAWREFWRQEVFLADQFVVKVGYKSQLITMLEYYTPLQPVGSLFDQDEPYYKERLERIRNLA